MFWIILLSYLAGCISTGMVILFVLCLLAAGARQEEAMEKLEGPALGPFP